MKNKLIVAAAGSGKTTLLVKEALKKVGSGTVIITTFTEANEAEIKKRFHEINGHIPASITVQTWFSFLLEHGARPYQGGIFDEKIRGLILISGQSATYVPESNTATFYFDKSKKIYSDKLAQFVYKCDSEKNGQVIKRLTKIFAHIFIDEVQDLSGYDLELLRKIFNSVATVLLVCDPRQGTYSTSAARKNKQFSKAGILDFFHQKEFQSILEIDANLLSKNFRSNQLICDYSNKLYPAPEFPTAASAREEGAVEHEGVFVVREEHIDAYLDEYPDCIQLRESRREKRPRGNRRVMNFGESKGLGFERVLVYPNGTILKWIIDSAFELAPTTRSKFYVALTRARHSVAIVYNYKDEEVLDGATRHVPKAFTIETPGEDKTE